MIFTDYNQHIAIIIARPVCTAIKNDTTGIKLCLSFSQGIKIKKNKNRQKHSTYLSVSVYVVTVIHTDLTVFTV